MNTEHPVSAGSTRRAVGSAKKDRAAPAPGSSVQRPRWVKAMMAVCVLATLAAGTGAYLRPLEVVRELTRLRMQASGVRSHELVIGAYRVHYYEAGPTTSDKVPILLIHGLGGQATDWATIIPKLAKDGRKVYALDLLGYGRSSKPDVDYSISQETDFVRGFMDNVGIRQADVVGWSMGGWIALKLTLDHPERVRRVVLNDSAGLSFAVDPAIFHLQNRNDLERLERILTPNYHPIPDFLAEDLLRRSRDYGWVVQRSVASMMKGRDLLDGKLGAIQRPVLVVWGSKDNLIPLKIGERMHTEIPQSVMVTVDGCGHLAPVECQAKIVPAMSEFLDAPVAPRDNEEQLAEK